MKDNLIVYTSHGIGLSKEGFIKVIDNSFTELSQLVDIEFLIKKELEKREKDETNNL